MSIKCGKGHQHETVADVKACYGQTASVTGTMTDRLASSAGLATVRQVKFLESLLSRQHLILSAGRKAADLDKRTASRLIDNLLKRKPGRTPPAGTGYDPGRMSADGDPRGYGEPGNYAEDAAIAAESALPDVPAGHYAVDSLTGNNDLDFFRVDRPAEGRWAGRTFVKRVIGGQPSSPVRGSTARKALDAILAASPDKAAQLYGQEIGRCSRCNRHLTDEISRQFGIGPDCRNK